MMGKIGAVLVTVNTNYQAHELDYLLKQSDAAALIIMDSYRGTSYPDIVNSLIPELQEANLCLVPMIHASQPFIANIDQRF